MCEHSDHLILHIKLSMLRHASSLVSDLSILTTVNMMCIFSPFQNELVSSLQWSLSLMATLTLLKSLQTRPSNQLLSKHVLKDVLPLWAQNNYIQQILNRVLQPVLFWPSCICWWIKNISSMLDRNTVTPKKGWKQRKEAICLRSWGSGWISMTIVYKVMIDFCVFCLRIWGRLKWLTHHSLSCRTDDISCVQLIYNQ